MSKTLNKSMIWGVDPWESLPYGYLESLLSFDVGLLPQGASIAVAAWMKHRAGAPTDGFPIMRLAANQTVSGEQMSMFVDYESGALRIRSSDDTAALGLLPAGNESTPVTVSTDLAGWTMCLFASGLWGASHAYRTLGINGTIQTADTTPLTVDGEAYGRFTIGGSSGGTKFAMNNLLVAYLTIWVGDIDALVSSGEFSAMTGSGPDAGDAVAPWLAAPNNANRTIVFAGGKNLTAVVGGGLSEVGTDFVNTTDNPKIAPIDTDDDNGLCVLEGISMRCSGGFFEP